MNNQKKVIVVLLIILTISLGGSSIFLSQLLQQTQAPTESSASGFGEAVNKKYFEDFYNEFLGLGCFGLISKSRIDASAPISYPNANNFEYSITNLEPKAKNPVNCTIKLDEDRSIELSIFTYDKDSAIDSSAEALFARINSNIIDISDTIKADNMNYFFGKDVKDPTSCRANFFNERNDFEYITLKYKNFSEKCSDANLKSLNSAIIYNIDTTVDRIIESVVKGENE